MGPPALNSEEGRGAPSWPEGQVGVVKVDILSQAASALLVQVLENGKFGFTSPGLEQASGLPKLFGDESRPFILPSPDHLGPTWVLRRNPQRCKSFPASPKPGPTGTSAKTIHRSPL